MQKYLTVAVVALLAGTQAMGSGPKLTKVDPSNPCHLESEGPKPQKVLKPLEPVNSLPKQWIWNNIDGVNYLTNMKNQHVPQYCGSCWAQAATSSLSDRIKIMRKAAWPDINIAPQVLISCEMKDQGCHGGEPLNAFEYIHDNYITDETCAIYRARGHDNGAECSPMLRCKNCAPHEDCFIPDSFYQYTVTEYGPVTGEKEIMQEIYQRGPVACGIAVTEELEKYTGGIFEDKTGDLNIVHDISIVGWGEDEEGTPYWTIRNSWGTHWGEQGFLRLIRGKNNLAIESNCAWAVPKDMWSTPADDMVHTTTDDERNDPKNDKEKNNGPYPEMSDEFLKFNGACRRVPKVQFANGEKRTQPRAWEVVDQKDLPASVDWRNVDGTNYLSWNKNQHIPIYCGSCWSQGTTSSLADRFNILNKNLNPTPIALSAQVVVNCQAGGSCNGGNPGAVYEWAADHGIPDSTCEQYVAKNLDKDECEDIDICRDCSWPPPAEGDDGLKGCWATPWRKYHVSDYYGLSGADKMKAELYKNGPISCGIQATPEFEKYDGKSIYSQKIDFPMINHEIAVVGYGADKDGNEYWIGRNSWGTYWGDYGFFYMKMHSDNLAIEQDCTAGIPSYKKSTEFPTQ